MNTGIIVFLTENFPFIILVLFFSALLILLGIQGKNSLKKENKSSFKDVIVNCIKSCYETNKKRNIIFSIIVYILLLFVTYSVWEAKTKLDTKYLIILTFITGIVLLVIILLFVIFANDIVDIFEHVKDENKIQSILIVNFIFILFLLEGVLLMERMEKYVLVFYGIGVLVNFLFTLASMFYFMTQKLSAISNNVSKKTRKRTFLRCSLYLIITVIISLYLLVVLASKYDSNAFGKTNFDNGVFITKAVTNKFELLYYTVISFTTIGYGDISANTWCGQLVSIIISVTSVICLIVFIGSVLSVQGDNLDEIADNNNDNEKIDKNNEAKEDNNKQNKTKDNQKKKIEN